MIQFSTSVDCCQRFMEHVNFEYALQSDPQVGDEIVIYSDPDGEICMKVSSRKWKKNFKISKSVDLICHLSPPDGCTIPMLEARLRQLGFPC